MASKIDYGALAAQLRGAYAHRSARVDRARDQKLTEGAVPLDDVLRFLDTEAASPLVGRLTADARRVLDEQAARKAADPQRAPYDVFGDAWRSDDPFEAALSRALTERDPWRRGVDAAEVPRAVVEALATAARDDGLLTAAQVEARLGPLGRKVFEACRAGLLSFRPGTERPKLKYEGLSWTTRNKVALSAGRQTFAERMPALAELIAECGRPGQFAGFTMASVQHLFPSTMALYDALEAGGLRRPQTGVGGKNYSANPDVTARMQAEGWHVAQQAHPTPQSAGLDAEQTVYEMAVDQLRTLFKGCDPKRETKPRFLILDDGGKLIRALHDRFPQYAHLCVAVEQTDRGIQVIEKMETEGRKLLCPVVDMARSPVKKQHEAPMIGEAIVSNALAAVDGLTAGLAAAPGPAPTGEAKTATVVGFGAIGEATARALLRRGYTVFVTDPSPEARARAEAAGCTALDRDEALGQGRLLFSCTGRTTITPAEFGKLPSGCVLVNGASGNHELGLHELAPDFFATHDPAAHRTGADRLRSSFGGREVDLGDALADDAMMHRVIREGDHEVLVLRSGYVINMTDGLPPEYVQLVLGLLWASCAQAVDEGRPGLVELQSGPAAFLKARTERDLARRGLALDTPDFTALPSWRL